MKNTINIAIAGLGTVGTGTVKILQNHAQMIAQRSGRDVKIVAVSARDKKK
jgi:homoserine dehydrogenase